MRATEGSEAISSTKKRLLRRGVYTERSECAPRNDIVGQPPVSICVIPTGPVSPAHKRDMALVHAKGEIIAFLDDDAYPVKDWLKNAVVHFSDNNVAAVGGPAVTPPGDNLRQAASGAVYSSVLVSGKFVYRYLPKVIQEVDDYPSCNFLVRKSVLLELGGFNTSFWPGEDTKLCLEITKRLGKKIIYDPAVLVFHHRRQLFLPHLKQIANYALHRGYFVKKYPETSFKSAYFIPSIFVSAVILGAALFFWFISIKIIYIFSLLLYLLLVFISSINAFRLPGLGKAKIFLNPGSRKGNNLRLIPYVFLGIIITHFAYGFFFIKGLLSKKLQEES